MIQEQKVIEGFRCLKIAPLPKLKSTYYLLQHEKTNSPYIHIASQDTNNCFAVGLRTTPQDSTGVAHILEHTVLCGSKKYPVRDPFFAMTQRSVNTFMNAFTASDWTLYPFCTQNHQDFYNLMDVYLDAVFFPNLDPLNFQQEGHRLEFQTPQDESSPLMIKGIVYNEMKGSLSSPSSLLIHHILSELYPTTTYHYNSGGDPEEIPNLTYEVFKNFHSTYYHPSNAYFFSYGHFPLEEHLKKIDDHILRHFKAINPHSEVPDEVKIKAPYTKKYDYPLEKTEDDGAKHQITVNWRMPHLTESQEILALQLISSILLGHAGAPLQKTLLESQLGKSLSGHTGFHDDIRETLFSVGLQGVKEENFEQIEKLILNCLKEVVQRGIDGEEVESVLHQIEFKAREVTENFGLDLLLRLFGVWIHQGNPLHVLDVDQELKILKEKLKEPRYLEKKIESYFLQNPQRVTVTLSPDHTLAKRQEEALQKKLELKKSQMSQKEKEEIKRLAQKLEEHQSAIQPIHLLPKIEVKDLERSIPIEKDPIKTVKDGPHQLALYERPTNGLFYLTLLFPLEHLTLEELKETPLFSSLLTQSGTTKKNYEEVARKMVRYTGGIGATPLCLPQVDSTSPQLKMEISTACLNENLPQMMSLLKELLCEWNFLDLKRTQTLIRKRAHGLKNSVVGQGHSYAKLLALREFNLSNFYTEELKGVAQVKKMQSIENYTLSELKPYVNKLQNLGKKILTKNLHIIAVSDQKTLTQFEKQIPPLLQSLSTPSTAKIEKLNFTPSPWKKEAWTTTTPVSYVARAFKAPTYTHPHAPIFKVFSHILSHKYLHTEIREKGGAYGGACSYSSLQEYLSLTSYRDPHLKETYDVYDGLIKWLDEFPLTQQEIDEGIVQTVADLDAPSTPADDAIDDYYHQLQGLTPSIRQQFRDQVFKVDKDEAKKIMKEWLSLPFSDVAVTGSEIVKKDKPLEFTEHPI